MRNKIDLEFMKIVFEESINFKKKLTLNSAFEEVPGWDSLGHMKIISILEKKLRVNFEIEEIVGVNSVKKLIKLAQKKINVKTTR